MYSDDLKYLSYVCHRLRTKSQRIYIKESTLNQSYGIARRHGHRHRHTNVRTPTWSRCSRLQVLSIDF